MRTENSRIDLSKAVITDHAMQQMAKRGIAQAEVVRVLALAEELILVRPGRVVVQGGAGEHLLRVFVDVDRTPPEVVTAYRTSKIGKYRSER